jgi:hypothetical protein
MLASHTLSFTFGLAPDALTTPLSGVVR